MSSDARDIVMGEVTYQDVPALFSELRLDRATIPKELHVYELRHSDTDPLDPAQIAKNIWVNFYGTLITARPLKMPREGIYLDENPFDFASSETMKLDYFMQLNQVKTKPPKARER